MDGLRIIAFTEKDLQDKLAKHFAEQIARYQKCNSSNCVFGISGSNGHSRRSRAREVFTALASWTEPAVDWSRVRIFLLDERYGFESEDDGNANLVRESLVKTLRKRGIDFKEEEQLLAPDITKPWEEAAEDYERRLRHFFKVEGVDAPALVSCGLGDDHSIGSIFPTYYKDHPNRWMDASARILKVLRTETSEYEVSQRIAVNLSVYRNAGHVVIFLGDQEHWSSPHSPVHENEDPSALLHLVSNNPVATDTLAGFAHARKGKLRLSKSLTNKNVFDSEEELTPLAYITQCRYVTTAQVRRNVTSHLNLVVFGAAGDLAKKKTFPSIFQLHLNRVLPSNVSILACDDPDYHKDISDTESLIQNRLQPYLEKECKKPTDLRDFCSTLHFAPVNFKDVETFRELHKCLQTNANGLVDNRIFYLALPPFLFREAVKLIRQECWPGTGYVRVIVEKPFGHDLQSARDLASQLSEYLVESQVYRIDHYLAKNMVLNILALRFANRELGRLFHADNVSIVRITFKENINVAGRAGYFDGYGIIRDVMQNHLLQLLTLVLMEAPASLNPEDVRDEKVKVLKQFRAVRREDCVVGQYNGYQDDPDIQRINEKKGHRSKCPTFAACVLHLDNERWSNVPIIMKAGKSLERRSTIVRLQFKKAPPQSLFGDQPQNELVIRIQPDEAIYYRMLAKSPGLAARAHEVQRTVLDLDLRKEEVGRLPEAYEKLIHDVIIGDSHNFVRADEVEEGWRIFDPLLKSLETSDAPDPFPYEQGARGPPEADELINSTGYRRYTATGVQGLAQDFH